MNTKPSKEELLYRERLLADMEKDDEIAEQSRLAYNRRLRMLQNIDVLPESEPEKPPVSH